MLIRGTRAMPPLHPWLMISLARSGDSPESCAVIDLFQENDPNGRHVIITCNRSGRLATSFRDEPHFCAITLADRTCDCSLAMTSSFTNMVLPATFMATGAGDSFNAGFLHAWLRRMPLNRCLQFGNACGAISALGLGGISTQPSLLNVEDFLKAQPLEQEVSQ